MFELKIANPDVTSGTVQVSWCLDQEALKYLTDRDVKDPQVVLVVAPEGAPEKYHHNSTEVRAVVPLKDMVAFLEFKYPGANRIWGFISTKTKKQAHDLYMTKKNGLYDTDVLDFDAQTWAAWMDKKGELDAQPLSVEVPEGVFAPEPAQWEQDWVNLFFKEKCVDQCHFRKRRLFAYLVQPLMMLPNMLLRILVLLFSVLIGARGTSLKYLNPIAYGLGDAPDMISGGTIFIRHLPEDDEDGRLPDTFKATLWYGLRSFWSLPFMPLVSIPLIALAILGKWHTLIVVGIVLASMPILAAIVFGLVFVLEAGVLGKFFRFIAKFFETKEPEGYWYMDQEEMDLLVCANQKEPLTVGKLPLKKRTLKLRFQNLKTKVCRPFAG